MGAGPHERLGPRGGDRAPVGGSRHERTNPPVPEHEVIVTGVRQNPARERLPGAGEGVRFSDSGRLGLGCVTPGAYEVSFWAASRRWGAEVNAGSQGNLEEPVVVSGRAAGL